MNRCPTCNAKYLGKKLCHRCGTDIGRLVNIKQKGLNHKDNAVKAFHNQDYKAMKYHAGRSCSLYQSGDNTTILACAALMNRDFEKAFSIWNDNFR